MEEKIFLFVCLNYFPVLFRFSIFQIFKFTNSFYFEMAYTLFHNCFIAFTYSFQCIFIIFNCFIPVIHFSYPMVLISGCFTIYVKPGFVFIFLYILLFFFTPNTFLALSRNNISVVETILFMLDSLISFLWVVMFKIVDNLSFIFSSLRFT